MGPGCRAHKPGCRPSSALTDGTLEPVTEALGSWAVKWGASRPHPPHGVVFRIKWLTWDLVSTR